MSRKRARDEDEENLVEIDEDAVSVSQSSGYDPVSSPMKISPSSSPGPGRSKILSFFDLITERK